jgi:hypothetical protein
MKDKTKDFKRLVKQIKTKINKGKLIMDMSKIIQHPFLKGIKTNGGMQKMNEWCETNGHKNLSNLLQDPSLNQCTDRALALLDTMNEHLEKGTLWDQSLAELMESIPASVEPEPELEPEELSVPPMVSNPSINTDKSTDETDALAQDAMQGHVEAVADKHSTIEGMIRQSTNNPLPNPAGISMLMVEEAVQQKITQAIPGIVNAIMNECDKRYFRKGSIEIHMVDLNDT